MQFPCPTCGAQLSAPDDCAGRTSACRFCKAPLTIPYPAAGAAPARSRKPWLAAAVAGGSLFLCLCLIPAIFVGTWSMRPNAAAPGGEVAAAGGKAQAPNKGDLAEKNDVPPEAKALPAAVEQIPQHSSWEPDLTVTAPRLGTLRNHPWWKRPITNGDISKIMTAIETLPSRKKLFFLDADGSMTMHDDLPPFNGNPWLGVIVVGDKDTTQLLFYANKLQYHPKPYVPHGAAVSLLCQGLDAAYASEERFRKTGQGFSAWDQFIRMGDVKIDDGPAMPKIQGGGGAPK